MRIIFLFMILIASASFCYAQNARKEYCLTCHKATTPGIFMQWQESGHALNNVSCIDCHGAAKDDADSFNHRGAYISATPKDCGKCHNLEAMEVQESYHATAGEILESQDAYMAHIVGGEPAAVLGCESCHGAKVIIDSDSPNKLSRESWPNSGIGRINPDGSKGSCSACHTRHSFTKTQARQPESCSKCHLGPDHPQKEVYEESKHGNTYYFDALVELYNEKFARPATEIMNLIRDRNLLKNPADFSNRIEWTYWELWHHEGRRARHGAAMMGPDYTWWHGIYEVAQHFYFKFIPEALQFKDPDVDNHISTLLEKDEMHQWMSRNNEELKKGIRSGKIQEIYRKLYEKKGR